MPTRANIRIKTEENEFTLFTMFDGYPSGLLVDLLNYSRGTRDQFLKKLKDNYKEINWAGDVDYNYLIDFNTKKIYTFDARFNFKTLSGLLRIDNFGDRTWPDQVEFYEL